MPTPILDGLRAGNPPAGVPGETHAVLVEHHGERVCEYYATDASVPCGPHTTHRSWSVAKSVVHGIVGAMVLDGTLTDADLAAPAPVAEWRNDQRRHITPQHLLDMRSGLAWREEYVDPTRSDVVDMLWGSGRDDVAAYATARPLAHQPGSTWCYSSGTTNILCSVLGDALVGGGAPGGNGGPDQRRAAAAVRRAAMETYVTERLFAPAGMTHTTPKFDAAGTFVGSSFLFATAGDYLRFGRLYANDGLVEGTRVLPAGWRERARTFSSRGDDPDLDYGSHWWLFNRLPGAFAACGYEGQFIVVLPEEDLVVVRLGRTPIDDDPLVRAWLVQLVEETAG